MRSLLERWSENTSIPDDETECWIWCGTLTRGYGVLGCTPSNILAHRFAYEHFVGPIPDGRQLHHTCGNKGCVNPDHLEPVTQAEHSRQHRKCSHDDRRIRPDGRSECRTCRLEAERRRWADPAFRALVAARKRERRALDSEWREKEREYCRAYYRSRVAEP